MFYMRLLQERHGELNKELQLVFIDLEKAYNIVSRDLIWHLLRKRKVQEV